MRASLAAIPSHHDDPALMLRALANREKRIHAELLHLRRIEHFDGDAKFLQCAAATGELFRVKDIGGLIDEITGEKDALCSRATCGKRFFRGGKIGDGDERP